MLPLNLYLNLFLYLYLILFLPLACSLLFVCFRFAIFGRTALETAGCLAAAGVQRGADEEEDDPDDGGQALQLRLLAAEGVAADGAVGLRLVVLVLDQLQGLEEAFIEGELFPVHRRSPFRRGGGDALYTFRPYSRQSCTEGGNRGKIIFPPTFFRGFQPRALGYFCPATKVTKSALKWASPPLRIPQITVVI